MRLSKAIKALERELDNVADYATWREVAAKIDALEGKDAWREDYVSPDYNYDLIQERMRELRELKEKNNVRELVFWLHEGLHGNIANISSPALYDCARAGTKHLISTYVNEVAAVLDYVCDTDFPEFSFEDKMRFFKRTGKVFGRSALMLSGGANLGLFHIGVIKGLFDSGLLPRVISGSSAGSIIAGTIGSHSDEELPQFFDPEYLQTDAWRSLGMRNLLKEGALMDADHLEECLRQNMGTYSFEEAFQHSGRIINITVSPVHEHQQPRLLNYLTSPHVLVLRASLASCAVPGLFPPVMLQAKNIHGEIIPYIPTLRWSDGSLKSDLPMLRLSRLHDVNHYIVSQTNPHILPFLARKNTKKGLLPFARQLVSSSMQINGKHLLEISRQHIGSNGIGRLLDEAHAVVSQQYRGDITVSPKFRPGHYRRLISDPTPDQTARLILAGERAIWPRIEQIRNATTVSRRFDTCIERLKLRMNQHPAGVRSLHEAC